MSFQRSQYFYQFFFTIVFASALVAKLRKFSLVFLKPIPPPKTWVLPEYSFTDCEYFQDHMYQVKAEILCYCTIVYLPYYSWFL